MYTLIRTSPFTRDLKKLKKGRPADIKKLKSFLKELEVHPETGTGQVEKLKHEPEGTYSRRINKSHRLIYRIEDDKVYLLRCNKHYGDK